MDINAILGDVRTARERLGRAWALSNSQYEIAAALDALERIEERLMGETFDLPVVVDVEEIRGCGDA